jgi:putative phosphoribosyl transferase
MGAMSMNNIFRNRSEAGRLLAMRLMRYAGRSDVVVLSLPRGGVPVAYEVARLLGVPLDVSVVRKLGVPRYEELAMGAIASGGLCVLNHDVVRELAIPRRLIDSVVDRESREIERREHEYRLGRRRLAVRGRTVILVDDGIATGSTMRVAVEALRQLAPARIVVAVPVAARSSFEEFQRSAEECVCLRTPEPFMAVGVWYEDFSQTTDEQVRELLYLASGRGPQANTPVETVRPPRLGGSAA